MKKQIIKITDIENVTHDTLRLTMEKPLGIEYKPGQATELAINKEGWKNEGRPFTFTSLPHQQNIEFVIKTYPSHEGVTNKLRDLEKGDELLIDEVFGAITYKGEGVFIAGGAGVTPFIAIFRDLKEKGKIGDNMLIFGNKTSKDIILKDEFENMLGDNFMNVLSVEQNKKYDYGLITKDYLEKRINSFNQYFYICGPLPMLEKLEESLLALGADKNKIVKEDL
jgi:ferredoxin-NADP reductase